ncbi:hypothetical protein SLA2020_500180 [Shorea laevis]
MASARKYGSQGGTFQDDNRFGRNYLSNNNSMRNKNWNRNWNNNQARNFSHRHGLLRQFHAHGNPYHYPQSDATPSLKRRKISENTWGDSGRARTYHTAAAAAAASLNSNNLVPPLRSDAGASTSNTGKRDRSRLEDDERVFMSRYEIERYSPSRKDGIDALREMQLRYSYCTFIQNLGVRLELPQTTIGTAMVLCHRFFVRRSHACHDRFLIATAALFLAAKSEDTPRPLNDVLRASCEIFHNRDITFLSYLLPVDWFEQYRERVIEAEQMILTTLNFELNVQHPYAPLTSALSKLGLSQTILFKMALNLVSEGLRSSLWLQFKPHHIAAGAAYLAAKFLNFDLSSYHSIWWEFETTSDILQDVAQQLMELL